VGHHAVVLLLQVGELLVEGFQALLRRRVGLLRQRDLLDLELRMRRSTTSISVGSESISMRSLTPPRRPGRSPCRAGSGR
jgi:hypothetical protein